jgi:hypothetical protein
MLVFRFSLAAQGKLDFAGDEGTQIPGYTDLPLLDEKTQIPGDNDTEQS